MVEDYLEKVSDTGIIIRVNINKGSYMVFKENKPLINPKNTKQSIVHEIPQIIFLGKEFDLRVAYQDRLGFFSVNGGQIFIPFWVKGVSDVRHVKLPALIDSNLLPAFIYHFQGFHFGSIPASISGMNYFIVDSRTDREILIRLKMHFPMSRVVVYRGERDALFENLSGEDNSGGFSNVRAVDIAGTDDVGMLSQNPAFAARVYLRKLDFEKMEKIPYRFPLDSGTIEAILAYLRIMIIKSAEKKDLKPHVEKINELSNTYRLLLPFMSFDVAKVEQSFDQGIPEIQVLKQTRNILKAQSSIHQAEVDPKKQRFFMNVLSMIEPLIPDVD